jgi:hypothetical protein
VHLNTPEDDLIASSPPSDNSPVRPSLDSLRGANLINRKPVPVVPKPASLAKPDEPALRAPEFTSTVRSGEKQGNDSPTQAPATHPALSQNPSLLSSQRPIPPSIPRKPLGPRPIAVDTNIPGKSVSKEPPPFEQLIEQLSLPPRPDEIDNHPDYAGRPLPLSLPVGPNSRTPSPSKPRPFTPFSLTVIRRDPSSSQQWNVGQVASFQLENPEAVPDDKYIPSPSISIHLETPGYSKFRGMPPPGANFDIQDIRESLDMIRPGSSSAAAATAAAQSPSRQRIKPELSSAHAPPVASTVFERQVNMVYSPSLTATLKHAFRRRGSKDDGQPTSPKGFGHGRNTSVASAGSFGGDFDGSEAPVITVPGPGLKPQGYMFLSPWDGRCEFRTGNGGRSLICRHVLPSLGAQWNPLVDGGNEDGQGRHHRHLSGSGSPNSKGHNISELRFNLPSAELINKGDRSNEGRERTRDRIFNHIINKTEGDIDDDEYESYGFDLSLGKEKAGGGNRGKRAKMGKLIIWDDGLKMLDLVVAANVGIWWGVWERRSRRGSEENE